MTPRSLASATTCSSCYTKYVERSNADYRKIKEGLKKYNPAAIVLWAFHRMPSREGLTSRKVISFLKKHFKLSRDPSRTGKAIGSMLKHAVEFGLLKKKGNKYFLVPKM